MRGALCLRIPLSAKGRLNIVLGQVYPVRTIPMNSTVLSAHMLDEEDDMQVPTRWKICAKYWSFRFLRPLET